MGYPGEELEDIEATVQHVKRTAPDFFFTTVSYPVKGTRYFEDVASRLVSPKPWAEGSDRDYRIHGRRSRRFYQFADQLLRSEVELHRLTNGNVRPTVTPFLAELRSRIARAREGLRSSYSEVEV